MLNMQAAEREAALRTRQEQREFERAQVAAHYEHSPDIFSLALDSALTYSTAIYLSGDEDLETAQARKFAYLARLLAIQPGERALDVGCGWGSNLLYLAAHTGGTFHGLTLSAQQKEELSQRAVARGLAERVRVDVCHIEDLALPAESVDAILFSGSIVHMRNRAEIHRLVGSILKPGGRLLISDCYFPAEVRGDRGSSATDYIFYKTLGYCLLLNLSEELALIEQAGLDIVHVQDLTSSYVRTLAAWINNIRHNRTKIEALAPGFAAVLQTYMTVAQLSFIRRTALEYMILAVKGPARAFGGMYECTEHCWNLAGAGSIAPGR
ncbi:MAG: class I SAM-dependent methyltransferase [Acidobacteria bacterium]|nr:class I SAM-dependent methyltransferase [Acidobacteriota bacterium]